jgi:enoyl-CoA hydratase/carnithine racemase
MPEQGDAYHEIRDNVLWLTLNRPQAMNAINDGMVAALSEGLDAADASVRCVVVRAQGRAFSAGADLKAMRQKTQGDDTVNFVDRLFKLFNRLERFPRPVIAAVNGLALAGGLELVLCCDLVIAAHSAMLGDAHANYGLIPGGGGSVRLPRKIGPARAKYLMYTGEFRSAEELERAGLVNQVVSDDELDDTVATLAARLSEKSPLGLALMKQLVDDGLDQPRDIALRNEAMAIAVHSHSDDWSEGLAAFAERRKPVFTGR